ncbi:hypothetical protein PHAVU_003G254300 [Phaseolus vulgaris]|uniref:Uncharacterized protein n=1 Tax=Phaseolus vulgaris TaxID=3885 RepID=V7CCX1_PHAVU|nr:hypothetical protein PHAVU_003G254300g [Phaseolus vulgaris]ESW28047.1 hypothetical protein PHAVU_003G254300g [Phaseolus vulgaris]
MNTQMKLVVVVVLLAVCVGTTWGDFLGSAKASAEAKESATPTVKAAKDSASSTAKSAKDAAAPAVDAAAPTVEAAGKKSESFAQWAYAKISGGFGKKGGDDKAKMDQNEKN